MSLLFQSAEGVVRGESAGERRKGQDLGERESEGETVRVREREGERVKKRERRESLCFKRNVMLKKADRQKTSQSGVAMVTVLSVFLPNPQQRVT